VPTPEKPPRNSEVGTPESFLGGILFFRSRKNPSHFVSPNLKILPVVIVKLRKWGMNSSNASPKIEYDTGIVFELRERCLVCLVQIFESILICLLCFFFPHLNSFIAIGLRASTHLALSECIVCVLCFPTHNARIVFHRPFSEWFYWHKKSNKFKRKNHPPFFKPEAWE